MQYSERCSYGLAQLADSFGYVRLLAATDFRTRQSHRAKQRAAIVQSLVVTVVICTLMIGIASISWYLAFDRQQQNLPPLHVIMPVYRSFVPTVSEECAAVALGSGLAACAAWLWTRGMIAGIVCMRCGYTDSDRTGE